MIRPIAVMGDPVLKQIAREVTPEELPTAEVQAIIDDMLQTLKASKTGIGLAAPQISESIRIVALTDPMVVLVNPILTPMGEEMDVGIEGCLSVPDLQGEVRRHRTVRVQALSRTGKTIDTIWTRLRATVVQHEVDHLNGILYLERSGFTGAASTERVANPVPMGAEVGDRQTLVIDSETEVGGNRHVLWSFERRGKVVGMRIQPGGAIVRAAYLSGVRLKAQGYKAGAAEKFLVGAQGLHVAAGDQLRIELRIEKGKRRIVAEADVDWAAR